MSRLEGVQAVQKDRAFTEDKLKGEVLAGLAHGLDWVQILFESGYTITFMGSVCSVFSCTADCEDPKEILPACRSERQARREVALSMARGDLRLRIAQEMVLQEVGAVSPKAGDPRDRLLAQEMVREVVEAIGQELKGGERSSLSHSAALYSFAVAHALAAKELRRRAGELGEIGLGDPEDAPPELRCWVWGGCLVFAWDEDDARFALEEIGKDPDERELEERVEAFEAMRLDSRRVIKTPGEWGRVFGRGVALPEEDEGAGVCAACALPLGEDVSGVGGSLCRSCLDYGAQEHVPEESAT